MRPDLNFHPTNDENYTTEEPSSSNFSTIIFLNYCETRSSSNHMQNTISNFSQVGYYPTIHMMVVI
jgi:hypothetical protein